MFKKIIFKAIIMVIIFMGLGTYGAYLTGAPVPFFNAKTLEGIKESFASFTDSVKPENIGKTAKTAIEGEPEKLLFKWKDASGATFFGEKPPHDALEVKVFRNNDLNVNVVAATPIPEEEEEETSKTVAADDMVMPNPYSPEGVKQIMQQAKDVKQQMEERMEEQQKIMDQL